MSHKVEKPKIANKKPEKAKIAGGKNMEDIQINASETNESTNSINQPNGDDSNLQNKPTFEERLAQLEIENRRLKANLDKASSEAADWKKKFKSTQSESEQRAIEKAELEAQRDERLKTLERENMTYKYTKQYMGLGYSEDMAEKCAIAQIEGDQEELFKLQGLFLEKKEKELKAAILKNIPSGPTGSEEPQMTKEKFNSMKYSEMLEFKNKYPETFKKFIE